MKSRIIFVAIAMLLLTSVEVFAQQDTSEASADVAFWIAYWAKPRVVLFGPQEEAFNKDVHEIVFPWNVYDNPMNPNILDENVQWMKDHASDRFYIEGYSSAEGELGHNLALSNRRADWIKQALISKGIPEGQIVMAVGWGPLYPACAGLDDECLSKNRVVRFIYSPNQEGHAKSTPIDTAPHGGLVTASLHAAIHAAE